MILYPYKTVSVRILYVGAGIPDWIVLVIKNLDSKLYVALRWIDSISGLFNVMYGLRHGSILFLSLFTVFINTVIIKLRDSGLGCCMHYIYLDVFSMRMILFSQLLLSLAFGNAKYLSQNYFGRESFI